MVVSQEHNHGSPAFPVAAYPIQYHAGPEFLYFPHYHDELEFFHLTTGSLTVWVNTIPYTMNAGDSLIIPSAAIHSCKILRGDTCDTQALLCHPDFLLGRSNDVIYFEYLKRLTDANAAALYVSAKLPSASRVSHLFHELTAMLTSKSSAYELLAKSYLFELLYLVFIATDPQASSPTIDPAVSVIRQSLDYLQTHLNEDVSLTTLANLCCLSPSQYGRLFKRVMGCTPITYLMEKRIAYAKRLLTETDTRISDIAVKAGFNNFSYFNRCFRQYQGMTPSEYRQHNS